MTVEELRTEAQIELVKKRLGAPYLDIYQYFANRAARKAHSGRATQYRFGDVSEPTVVMQRCSQYIDRWTLKPVSYKFARLFPHRCKYESAVCVVMLPIEWRQANEDNRGPGDTGSDREGTTGEYHQENLS